MQYTLSYIAATITFRPDDESERALAALTADGRSASAAIRDALVHEAQRQDDERLRAEAVALAADPKMTSRRPVG